jgi:hypothetical protein
MDHAHLLWLNKLLSLINAYRALPFPAMDEEQLLALGNARIEILRHVQTLFRSNTLRPLATAPGVRGSDTETA